MCIEQQNLLNNNNDNKKIKTKRDRQAGRKTDRQARRQADRQTDRWADRLQDGLGTFVYKKSTGKHQEEEVKRNKSNNTVPHEVCYRPQRTKVGISSQLSSDQVRHEYKQTRCVVESTVPHIAQKTISTYKTVDRRSNRDSIRIQVPSWPN